MTSSLFDRRADTASHVFVKCVANTSDALPDHQTDHWTQRSRTFALTVGSVYVVLAVMVTGSVVDYLVTDDDGVGRLMVYSAALFEPWEGPVPSMGGGCQGWHPRWLVAGHQPGGAVVADDVGAGVCRVRGAG